MAIHSVGDQARAYVLQSQSARLRQTLQQLTDELSTGKVADPAGRVGGNTTVLHHFESQIALLEQFRQSGAEAATIAAATQQVLLAIKGEASGFSGNLLALGGSPTASSVSIRAAEAETVFESVVGRLNTEIAGLHLFAGQATDRPPLIEAAAFLDELRTLTAGLATAADVEAAITTWFNAPPGGGGYLDAAYGGTLGEPRLMQIAQDRTIAFATNAASPSIRDVLKSLALAAVAGSGAIAADSGQQLQLLRQASESLLSGEVGLVNEMGRVGLLEALADRFSTEHANAIAVAQIGRANLVTADPFQTATALKEVQTQMETLYTLTSRLSGLKLVDYLR